MHRCLHIWSGVERVWEKKIFDNFFILELYMENYIGIYGGYLDAFITFNKFPIDVVCLWVCKWKKIFFFLFIFIFPHIFLYIQPLYDEYICWSIRVEFQ